MATYTEAWAVGPRSANIYTRTYQATSPIAVLVAVHGAAEHSGRYTDAHTSFSVRGVTVFSYDQRGFGRTALDEEHKSKNSVYGKTCWDDQLLDLDWTVQYVYQRYPALPLFLIGSSMVRGDCRSHLGTGKSNRNTGSDIVLVVCDASRVQFREELPERFFPVNNTPRRLAEFVARSYSQLITGFPRW